MAERSVTGVARDEKHRIETLFGDDEAWSPVSAREAAAQLGSGVHHYSVDSPAGSVSIHAYQGRWVRTARDETSADNLDDLAGPNFRDLGAGAFDVCLTLGPTAAETMARELHASGVVISRVALLRDGTALDVALGPPSIVPCDPPEPGHFIVEREALCRVHDDSDAFDPGFDAVAVTRVECSVTVAMRPVDELARFVMSYTPAAIAPVRVQTALPAKRRDVVTGALSEWIARIDLDAWSLPLVDALAGTRSIQATVAPSGHVQIGLSFGGRRPLEFPEPDRNWDWTIAFSRPFLVQRIGAALSFHLGGLPAPMGGDRRVLIDAANSIYLTYLELGLVDGAVVLSGVAYRDAAPVVTANFSASFLVSLGADGLVAATLGGTDVEVVEWYAKVADVLSGGALTRAVEQGLRDAMSALGSDSAASFLTPELLARVVAAGTTSTVDLAPRIERAWVGQGSLRLAGSFDGARPRVPEPDVRALVDRATGRVLLHAGMTRTPGAALKSATWSIDGGPATVLDFERRSLVFAPQVATGHHEATLVVETDRATTASTTVEFDVP